MKTEIENQLISSKDDIRFRLNYVTLIWSDRNRNGVSYCQVVSGADFLCCRAKSIRLVCDRDRSLSKSHLRFETVTINVSDRLAYDVNDL